MSNQLHPNVAAYPNAVAVASAAIAAWLAVPNHTVPYDTIARTLHTADAFASDNGDYDDAVTLIDAAIAGADPLTNEVAAVRLAFPYTIVWTRQIQE